MTGLRIHPLSTDDAATAGALLAASHRDYPAFRAEFPDPAGPCWDTSDRAMRAVVFNEWQTFPTLEHVGNPPLVNAAV